MRIDANKTIIRDDTLIAIVDPNSGVNLDSRSTPRILSWQKCPGAVGSATRITGTTLGELHFRGAQGNVFGTSTCTHLNDLLRSVADVQALIPLLHARG
jgi:hypothetical protein